MMMVEIGLTFTENIDYSVRYLRKVQSAFFTDNNAHWSEEFLKAGQCFYKPLYILYKGFQTSSLLYTVYFYISEYTIYYILTI